MWFNHEKTNKPIAKKCRIKMASHTPKSGLFSSRYFVYKMANLLNTSLHVK